MANNCSLKFNETKVYTNLKAEVGNDDVLFNSLMSAVIDGSRPSGFNKEFETYYANNYGSIPNTNDESKEVATAIQNFYKNRNFNVNEHTTDSAFISDVKSKGYTSTAAKTCGIRTTGNLMLAFYHNDLIKGRLEEHAEDRKDNLANRVINRMLGAVATNILEARKVEATKEEIAKVRKQLMNTKSNDFVKLEDEVSKTTPQLRNQFATLKDMLSDKVKYFTQVIQTDDRLGEIRFKKDDDLSQQEADWSESFDIEDDDDLNLNNAADNASNNEKDTTTARWEDNGTKSDFMKDFSFAVRSYLSTIPKLSSTEVSADGKYQYDKSNPLGMVDYMDFKVVNSAIRGDIETTNIDAFLKKLEDIAKSNKEYAGLAYLANDLKKKPDFAYKLFQVYRRRTIRKQQVRIDDNSVSPTRSNNRADKLETLRINYLNDIKSTALNIMIEDTNDILGAIKTKIDDYKTLQKTKGFDLNKEALSGDIINAIATRLKQYYPSLDKAAIERFARLNGKVDGKTPNIANNLTQLYGYLENTAKYANETLNNKRNLDNRFKEANKIKDKKAKKEALDSVREAYKQGYLSTNTKAYALELAKSLAPYSVVNIDSNSTNALGNQSADQINDSMITNFLNAVKATLTEQQKDGTKVSTELINYGKYKFQGVQYNLSGILMEHRDENGAVINYGLFYKDKDGNIQITNYARDMVNISLFDGAGNPNTKDNVLYSGMSKGDYVYTGFAQYFNAEQNPKMLMGDYFMRIPSDAPKNFVVHAPRYKVDGLFSKMHAIKNAKGEVIAKDVSVDDINENHPIVQQFRNIFKQELLDMVNFINIVFEVKENTETLEDGTVVDQRGRIVFNNDNTPMFKKGWGLDAESARRVFANYHIGKGHKHFIEKKGDGWAFNGLLFKDDRFVLTDYKTGTTTKYGDDLLKYLFPSLYGGARDGFIPFTTNANGEVELNLTADQEAMITRMVKGFVTDYSNNAITRMSEYKDLDINNLINEKNSIDFALNHRLMYIAFNDIFEGDTKFYKDTQTFLKRSKESQASGVPYGFVDTSLDLRENSTIIQGAFLNTPEVQSRLKAIGLDVQQKTKFNGITIKNTVRTSEECKVAKTYPDGKVEGEDGILVKDLVKNAKLTLEQARDLMGGPIMYDNNGKPKLNADGSYRRSGGFSNTTINDAQSYITFEEWIRRIAGRGQLNDYLPLIEAIQDESKEIPADLLKKFVQVQKNFYYDQYYDDKLNTIAPRQIKNAEFVLVPRFIRGTQLEQVYEAMKANKIDQLNTEETSKAGKARVLTIFDEKTGEVTEEHLKDFNNKAEDYREEYDYNHLYTQQETPQHMNAKNKAGIQIMKKILDNIDSNSPLHAYKEDFFNMYVANIKDSFNKLVDELKISLDEDGNIKFDESGNITGVDMQVFFDKLKDECMRLGLDSNMMDFVTLNASMPIAANGCPNPVMPTYLSNVVNKLESISQAMFNSAITRQELPGFHAAQITNVGFKATKDQVSYSKELKYHPNGERYIEIMLPASNFGFAKNADGTYKKSKEELLKELQDAGLDTLIGYRIPTEGKQSVCVMKVVGFLDDAQGSTIVVPDDWVSQTGSDFDIDSVYGIQYNTYIDKHGNIRKQDYSEKLDIYDYANYVNRHLEKADKIKDKSVKEAFEKLNKEIDEQFEKFRKELAEEKTQAYDVLSDETKELVKAAHKAFESQAVKNPETGKLTKDSYLKQLQFVADYIRTNKTNLDAADDNFISVDEDIVDSISNEYIDKKTFKSDKAKEILQARIDKFNKAAKKLGIMSYKQYLAQNVEDANTREARNNRLLDDMIHILQANESLEENLSRSNFESIIAARDKVMNPVVKEVREARSPYDFLDQAAYQEDVMSGAKLKAFSVTRDTFCSVCNTVHPHITDKYTIKVAYSKDKYNLEELQKKFEKVEETDEGYVVTHNTLGWTNDNKNVDGYILTAYSSQTTAHILDAVKEGAIPNVNDFTFAVYKTLADIGSNYDTAVGFIMQPAITKIVNAYNANKSIYSDKHNKPIEEAIKSTGKEILNTYHINTDKMNLGEIVARVNGLLGTKYSLDKHNDITLSPDELAKRLLNNDSRPVKGTEYIKHNTYSGLIDYNDNSVFVFGSNPLGINGNPSKGTGGAALVALTQGRVQQGEIMDNTISNNGRAYGLTTVKAPNARNNKLNQLSIDEITNNIKKLYQYANTHKDKTFKVAYTDSKLLNGHSIEELVNAFINAGEIPNNVLFSDTLNKYFVKQTNINKENINNIAIDWGVLFAYNDLSKLSDKIGATARVCNPDRFGAKQSIFATRKVFNDIADLIEDENPALVVGTSSIVNSIYAGYDPTKSLRSYITSNAKSAYSSLNSFLKYASAPSILVNRMLFDTEQDNFRIANRAIEVINGSNNVTEKDYKGFTQYILNAAYKQTDAVVNNYTYDVEKKQTIVNKEFDETDEALRIMGYGCTPDFTFNVKDVTNPTQEEVNAWSKLSPAQKISWLKANSVDAGIFNYINTNLFNEYEMNRDGQSRQTIRFNEDAVDNETAYNLFDTAFSSDNPLVKLAAMDMVKYAFVAEGFKIGRGAINKCIKNTALRDENTFVQYNGSRTSIIAQIKAQVDNAVSRTDLVEQYLRSDPGVSNVPHKFMNKKYSSMFETVTRGMYEFSLDDKDNAIEFGFARESNTEFVPIQFNNYIYITKKEGNESVTRLYKIVSPDLGSGIGFAYPLNGLEAGEDREVSINNANNSVPLPSYYEAVIDNLMNSEVADYTLDELNELYKKHVATTKVNKVKAVTRFDIMSDANNDNGGAKDAIDKIIKTFNDYEGNRIFIQNMYLYDKTKYDSFTPPIHVEGETISNGGEPISINGNFLFRRATKVSIESHNIRTGEHIEEKPQLIEIVRETPMASSREEVTLGSASSKLEQSLRTTTDSFEKNIVKELNRRSGLGDIEAGKLMRQLRGEGFEQSTKGYKEFKDSVFYSGYAYLKHKVNSTLGKFSQFYRDENGNYFAINSPEVINVIKNNPALQRQFLETLADANAIVDKFGIINQIKADEIENPTLKFYIDEMQKMIKELSNSSIIDDAEVKFGLDYLQKLSNDPNIQNGIVSIYDGFHSSGWLDAWFGDLQEQGNSLVQVVTRKVMADIRAKESQAKDFAVAFGKHFEDIKARAAKVGASVDLNKIFDKNGNIVRNYTDKFVEDIKELKRNVAKARVNVQENPMEYIQAKHKLDKFLLDHVNREYVDSYYQKLYDEDEFIINNHPQIYSEYIKLREAIRQINSRRIDGVLSKEFEDKLVELRTKINDLTSQFIGNDYKPTYEYGFPGTEQAPDGSIIVTNQEVYDNARKQSLNDAVQLDQYLRRIKDIKEEYTAKEEKEGFRDMLDKMLNIIDNAEVRDSNGKVTTPASQLDTNKEYKKAKEWIVNNAHWSVDDVLKVRIEDAYKKLGITNFKASKARAFIKDKLAKGEQIYDEFGNIDASKFTNTEIAAIKEDVERNYGTTNTSLFSDRNLINSAEPTNEAAPSEFFKMLNSGGMTNPEYQEIITKINNITRKYYNSAAKIVETSKMSIEDLKALGDLYDELDKTKKHKGKGSYDAYQAYSKYAKENVNEQAYYSEEDEAKKRTEPEFYTLWKRVNARYEVLRDKKGKIVIDETTGKAVYDLTKAPKPNHWLYTTIVPNDAYWEDLNKDNPKEAARQKKEVEDKTKAQEFLSNTLETINTPQYYKAKNAALAKGIAYYKEWYDNNHVYNPFTHAYEALPIWNRTRVIPSIDNGEYSPNWTQTTLTPKAHYKNPNYIEGYTDNENYKTVETDDKNGTTHVPGYDNNLGLNEYEQEAKQYIQDTLMSFAKTETAKRAIASGMAPHRAKKAEHDAKWAAKQAKEFIGFSDMLPSGKDSWYEKIDYSEDRTIDIPMLMTQLKNKESVDLDNIRSTKPKRETYASDEAYEKDLEAYQKRIDEATKKNEEIHQKLLDRDYIGAIQDFISAAGHYNAIQDNKQLLFYTHRMLGKMKAYDTNLGWNNLRKDSQTSTSDETSYIEKVDTRLQEQFDNWVRRLVYDQYKIPQNKLTRTASMLQSFTSAKFMMLNITGGIGNITVGESAIAGEYIAKEYFTPTGWLKGKNMWRHAIPSFIRGMANEDSTTLADALVKFMNIVDFDEVNNRPTVHLDADTVLNKIRDFMYSPNSMGEHFMQNGAMFSMFFDNRMVKVPDAESNERLGYEAMTWEQYKNKFHEYAMRNIIGGNEELLNKYETFKKDILADDNKKKEYVWNRRDINTEFANLYLTKEQKKQFITERKKLEKEAKVKFEELPTVMDQVDLKDGRLAFKEGSILAELQAKSKDKEVGDGYMFLGYMKGKVISVNKKIHGVYDKLGAAQLEKQWWGSLAMQYHKHIYPGVMKHYRRKGYFNEERGTKEIGCAPALFDFLTTPIRQLRYKKEMSDGQVEVLESLQVLLKGYAEFAMNLQTNWQLMPKWQRASIERAAGDVVGALGGICTALAVRCIWDDDDLKNSLWGNLMLYEADELTTQSMMYNMLFLPQQFDQLWSSPIAGVTAGKDIMAACNNIAAYVMDDDYDPNYTSGRYAGQNKIIVKLGRQIPIYRSLNNLATLDKANSYYKTGDNLLTLINVKDWANDIRGTSSLER